MDFGGKILFFTKGNIPAIKISILGENTSADESGQVPDTKSSNVTLGKKVKWDNSQSHMYND